MALVLIVAVMDNMKIRPISNALCVKKAVSHAIQLVAWLAQVEKS